MTERDDQRLRAFFRELNEPIDPPVPPYASLTRPDRGASARAAARARTVPPARARVAFARAFGLVVVAGVLLLVMRGRPMRAPGAGNDDAMRLASEMSEWEGPTDFLLQTPGIEYLQSPPRFGAGTDDLPGDPPNPNQEEVSR